MLPSDVQRAFYPPLGTVKCKSHYLHRKDTGDNNHVGRELNAVMIFQVTLTNLRECGAKT